MKSQILRSLIWLALILAAWAISSWFHTLDKIYQLGAWITLLVGALFWFVYKVANIPHKERFRCSFYKSVIDSSGDYAAELYAHDIYLPAAPSIGTKVVVEQEKGDFSSGTIRDVTFRYHLYECYTEPRIMTASNNLGAILSQYKAHGWKIGLMNAKEANQAVRDWEESNP